MAYGYGDPNEKNSNPKPEFEKNTDSFGLSFAQSQQNRPELDLDRLQTRKNTEIGANKVQSIRENTLVDPSLRGFNNAKIPEDMPYHMKAIVKAIDFDPMSTESVVSLQNKLNAAGYTDSSGKPLTPDGRFGAKTAYAKAMLQKDADNEMKSMHV